MCKCNNWDTVSEQEVTGETGRTLTVRVVLDDTYDTKDDYDTLSDLDENGVALHCFHRRYRMPHVGSLPDSDSFDSWDAMRQELESQGLVCFSVSMTDHSGRTCYLGSGKDMWDSGQIGFVVVDPTRHTNAEEIARSRVEWYDSLLRGNVYGFIVEDEEGETLESVWGFVGDEAYCMQEGIEVAKTL